MAAQKDHPDPLLPRIAAGDADAVSEFISRYKGLVWWLVRQMASERDAEDAAQEIFVELWSSAGRYDPSKSSEPAFVAMVSRRRLIDRRRRVGRRPQETSLDAMEIEMVGQGSASVEAVVEASIAGQAIQALEAKERRVLALSVYHGLSHSEISHHTNLPLGTVKTYVRRGLARVREALTAPPRPTPEVAP
jgi:RNA polymerase sigma-70 factor (ECF subfamily)